MKCLNLQLFLFLNSSNSSGVHFFTTFTCDPKSQKFSHTPEDAGKIKPQNSKDSAGKAQISVKSLKETPNFRISAIIFSNFSIF